MRLALGALDRRPAPPTSWAADRPGRRYRPARGWCEEGLGIGREGVAVHRRRRSWRREARRGAGRERAWWSSNAMRSRRDIARRGACAAQPSHWWWPGLVHQDELRRVELGPEDRTRPRGARLCLARSPAACAVSNVIRGGGRSRGIVLSAKSRRARRSAARATLPGRCPRRVDRCIKASACASISTPAPVARAASALNCRCADTHQSSACARDAHAEPPRPRIPRRSQPRAPQSPGCEDQRKVLSHARWPPSPERSLNHDKMVLGNPSRFNRTPKNASIAGSRGPCPS